MTRKELIQYPDGQISVKADVIDRHFKMRINSYQNLIELISLKQIFDYNNLYGDTTLTIPCLFGQRSDRRFDYWQSFDLKIICDLINQCKFDRVEIFDPHSDVSLALINNSSKISSFEYIKRTIIDINNSSLMLVSPDAGAYKKVFKYAEDLKLPLVAANKFRDLDGNISLNITGNVKGKNCLIVDDILDGGYTFILLARKLRELGAIKVFLYVSHAYFHKGTDELLDVINHIYCTNSVKDVEYNEVTQFKFI